MTKKTLVTLLLDRSGSMQRIKDDTLGAINAYLGTLRESDSDIRFSLVTFDASPTLDLQKVCVAQRIKDVPDLKSSDYNPRGSTPLIDACFTSIQAVSESLAGRDDVNVVFVIQTDGQENASRESTWEALKSLIKEKEDLGWEFNFMGCGIDAYAQASRMGLSQEKTLSYGKNKEHNQAAFAATAANTRAYAEGVLASTSYSMEQKTSAGDGLDKTGDKQSSWETDLSLPLRSFSFESLAREEPLAPVRKSFNLDWGTSDGK